jgi:hypothetical protein
MALGAAGCRDLRAVCSAGQFPACPLQSSHPGSSSGAPSHRRDFSLVPSHVLLLDSDIKEISQFLVLVLKRGLLQMKTRSSLWEAVSILCFYIASFMQCPSKAFSKTSAIVCPLADGTKVNVQKVKWFSEGRSKSQSRVGKETQGSVLPGPSPARSQAWLSAACVFECPSHPCQHAAPLSIAT